MRAARSAESHRPSGRVIRAVTLDCWGTLFLDGPGSDEGYRRQRLLGMQAVLAGDRIAVDPRRLDRGYSAAARWADTLWQRHRDVAVGDFVVAVLEAVDAGLPDRLSAETMTALISAYASPALMAPPAVDPGARGALEALAAEGIRLAVISNTMRTPGEVLRQVLDKAGLLPLFSVVIFSDECRIRKPSPGIFLRALKDLDVPPGHAVHVGDDPILDVEGPRDAGMAAIQVTPDGRATAPVKPHAVIRHLGELTAALRRLR